MRESPAPSTGALVGAALQAARAFAPTPGAAPPVVPGYRLRSELGRGGQGTVWLAEHAATGREVAVKVAAPCIAPLHAADRARFAREVRILARLQHPNLVAVFDSGVTACGRAFFAMDRVRGERIDAFALGCGRDARRLAAAFAKVAGAVHRAHQAGVVHRDLKPSNLMVDDDGEPRVLDFGLAALTDPAQTDPAQTDPAQTDPAQTDPALTGAAPADAEPGFVGSPLWTSPEQATPGGQAETRSDLHALGAVLFDALCGAPPFAPEADLAAQLEAVRTRPAPDVRALRPDVDAELAAIVAHCLHKRPEDRYGSAADLAADLERWLAGAPLALWRDRRGYRLRKFAARHRGAVAFAALAAAAVLVGALLALWSWQETWNEREHLRRRNAANQVLLAAHAIDDDLVGRARELLAACPADLRDWEWYRLLWQTDRSASRVDCGERLLAVAASPDGRWLAAGGEDGGVLLMRGGGGDGDGGGDPVRLADLDGAVLGVAFAADGRSLCALAERGELLRWDLGGGDPAHVAPQRHAFGGTANQLALHPAGDRCAVALTDGRVLLWSWTQGEVIAERRCTATATATAWRRALCWTPAGDRLAIGDGRQLILCDARDLAELRRLPLPDVANTVAFCAGEERLLVGTRDGQLVLLRAADGHLLQRRAPHGNWIYRVAEGPDQRTVLSAGSDHTVKLWDGDTLLLRATLRGHAGRVFDAAFLGQLGRVVSVAEDGTVRHWDRDVVDSARVFEAHRDQVWGLGWTADGGRVATVSTDGTLRLSGATDARLEPIVVREAAALRAVALAPDGALLAVGRGDGEVVAFDPRDGGERWRARPLRSALLGLAFARGGARLVAADLGGDVVVLAAEDGAELHRWRAAAPARAFAAAPDGRRVLLGTTDGRAIVADVQDGRVLRELPAHERSVFGACWEPSGRRFCTAGSDGTAVVWDAETFAPRCTLRGHRNGVRAIAFHPGGTRVVTGGWDGTARVWDAATGELVLTLRGHDGRVEGVAFDPAGRRLATVGVDGTLRVWDAALPGDETRTLPDDRGERR
ncbi:MAG: WD40 repeat domain-containing serine/threonine protein kinase [Planctomycetota bacterium]